MTRTHATVIVGAALIALLAVFQVLTGSHFSLDAWNAQNIPRGSDLFGGAFPPLEGLRKRASGSQYILGVGKADITGLS